MASRPFLLLFVAITSLIEVSADDTFIFEPPSGKTGPAVALLLVQGASSPINGYKPVAKALQAAAPMPLWVGAPQFVADTPEPVQFDSKLKSVYKAMQDQGMKATQTVVFAHSLGGVFTQQHLANARAEPKFDAAILYGSTLLRSYRNTTKITAPVLTVDGDLDGLLRVTRQAEAWFHQVRGTSPTHPPTQPVVLLEGLNHWSVSSGPAPSNVRAHDLPAEVSEAAGHTAIANVVGAYLGALVGASGSAELEAALKSTADIVAPLVAAFTLEGNHRFNTPCDSDFPTNPTCDYPKYPDKSVLPYGPPKPLPPADCTCGSKWVMQSAQKMLAGLDASPVASRHPTLVTSDAFHSVSDVSPFHLPHIFHPPPGTACGASGACALNSTTVTEPVYDVKDELDLGLYPISASEYRSKLKSRQAIWEQAGATHVDYDKTDRNNVRACAAINEAAYEWALQAASGSAARARFDANGTRFTFGDDIYEGIGITGPKWIHAALKYEANGSNVQVSAPYFSTPNKDLGNVSYLETAGFHCASARLDPQTSGHPTLAALCLAPSRAYPSRAYTEVLDRDRAPQIASSSHLRARWNGYSSTHSTLPKRRCRRWRRWRRRRWQSGRMRRRC